jgi:hypothetical protein
VNYADALKTICKTYYTRREGYAIFINYLFDRTVSSFAVGMFMLAQKQHALQCADSFF